VVLGVVAASRGGTRKFGGLILQPNGHAAQTRERNVPQSSGKYIVVTAHRSRGLDAVTASYDAQLKGETVPALQVGKYSHCGRTVTDSRNVGQHRQWPVGRCSRVDLDLVHSWLDLCVAHQVH